MSDFETAQRQLFKARQAQRDAQIRVGQEKERLKPAKSTQAGSEALASLQKRAQIAVGAANAAVDDFAQFTDPRQNVGQLSDATPFVLFPVRLETRFATLGSGDGARHQLWVRIYPDDCSIDTFEPTLSVTELSNAKLFWQNIWRAGGIEADERAAWSSLVSAHGSGRAGYIVDNYQPVNLSAKSVKASASDEILTIPTQTALGAAEATAVSSYWRAFWIANGVLAQQAAANAALIAAVGNTRAAQLKSGYQPFNIADAPQPPLTRTSVALSVAYVVFPADPPTQQASWSQAPHVAQFPDRFVILGFNNNVQTIEAIGNVVTLPLYVGPDPSADPTADPTSAIHPDGADLYIPDPLQWMTDFERAVAVGMGVAIDLTPQQAQAGFDRLLVLGLQLSASSDDAKSALEDLLTHHSIGRAGLTLVPQGTPTHNTTGTGTGYTQLDDADQSFDDRLNSPLFTTTNNALEKRDGQWLGELLGLDTALFAKIHGADGRDQLQGRAMQHALWPATIGYWMDKLLAPVFNDDAVANTRWFFSEYVSGRGPVPAIRIGGQPYGVLPTTAFSRIAWVAPPAAGTRATAGSRQAFLHALYSVLRAVDGDWTTISAGAAHLGGATSDAHQQLLNVVGLQSGSVEFHSRYAESLSELYNTLNLWGLGPDLVQKLQALNLQAASAALLAKLGYPGTQQPDILNHFFLKDAGPVTQIIDDLPLSESYPIRAYTDDGRNYLQWLIDAANTSLDAVRLESGFSKNITPEALLYLYARHALMLGYYDTTYELYKGAGVLSDLQLAAMKPEPPFVHVAGTAPASESRFAALYAPQASVTGSPSQLLSDYITKNYRFVSAGAGLRDQVDALTRLATATTAQLERAFVEHIDLCTYRFDAWMLGFANYQLQTMRELGDKPRTGVYLGAYAWLEDLRPSTAQLAPVQLPDDVANNFTGSQPIKHDATNGGYILAPSLTHARTAAVLRAGYLANATPANPDTMAVNLSSDRVRAALLILEGIRNGQPLGALLGYQFERGLHDAYSLTEVDKFIYPLRKAFPLVADNLAPTKTAADVPIEAIEARNVFDGRKMLAQIQTSGNKVYPYGLTTLPAATTTELTALNAQTNLLLDAYDAIGDLALAEGVHQAVQGNFDRIAATLDAYTTGNFPPEPQVVETPTNGLGLTHRVALHLQAGLAPSAGATPRAQAQPALDAWLLSVLPPLNRIGCGVDWKDAAGNPKHADVLCSDLDVNPIDLLVLINPDPTQAMTELDDRIIRFVVNSAAPRPDAILKIAYRMAPLNTFSVFEISALVRALNSLVRGSRPLKSSDATLTQAATLDTDSNVFLDSARISIPLNALVALGSGMAGFLSGLTPLLADPVANRASLIAGIDGFIDSAVELLQRAAYFNLPLCGWGFAYSWRQSAVSDLLAQVNILVQRWTAKLAEFDGRITAYDSLPAATSNDDRFAALRAAELVISTQLAALPATPAMLRTLLVAKRAAFVGRLTQFTGVLTMAGTHFVAFFNAVNGLLPISGFDVTPFGTAALGDRAVRLAQDLATNMASHVKDLNSRTANAQTQLDAAAAAGAPVDQVTALTAAAAALFGDDFRIVPEFALSDAQSVEWVNALAASTGGSLLGWLKTTGAIDFPVDEWMCAVARVRPGIRAWESTVALSSALGQPALALTPIQFPYEAGAPWLAMQFPSNYKPDSDRLLYTACYSTPFDKSAPQTGLLLDEWSEIIPSTTHTTGLSFNFNRPDNEAPQAILVVTPASNSGHWVWADLVGALNETLDLAKKRAVEPDLLDAAPYSTLLPATVMAATLYGISISTSLSVANGVMRNPEITQRG